MPTQHKHILFALTMGLSGLVFGMLPALQTLEQTHALAWLFDWRGVVRAPADVVIVAIDGDSATRLGLPPKPAQWPRTVHAQLIAQLAQAGASTIIFDLLFDRAAAIPSQDIALAAALRAAGNVLLVESLVQEQLVVAGTDGSGVGTVRVERAIVPIALLAQAALGSAALPLPRDERINAAWFFKADDGAMATLPSLALQGHALAGYTRLMQHLRQRDPLFAATLPADATALRRSRSFNRVVRQLRRYVFAHPHLVNQLQQDLAHDRSVDAGTASTASTLRALLALYAGPDAGYLNFYGPARTITTIAYDRVLQGLPPDAVRGKAVFIGYSAATVNDQDRLRDDYHTVFSGADGLQLSGVEIGATAFANLLDGSMLRPLDPVWRLALLCGWGGGLALAARRWRVSHIAVAFTLGCGAYLVAAEWLFLRCQFWLPIVTPLLIQLPLVLLSAAVLRYLAASRQRDHIQHAFSHFIPPAMVEQLAGETHAIDAASALCSGICLATDAASYTSLAESMEPVALTALMNRYYAILFAPVAAHGGIVSDVKGDAMLAIWTGHHADRRLRAHACNAALEIQHNLDSLQQPGMASRVLPTRIGLDVGPLRLGNVGAGQHYEYRAVGDTVNTASRIENLNRQLGTSVLAAAAVIDGLDEFVLRPLGAFLLPGKSLPVTVVELRTWRDRQTRQDSWLCDTFATALDAFRQQRWEVALATFSSILERMPTDGPSRFYLHQCVRNITEAPAQPWNAVMRIDEK
ncbi:adenylate/guanylate cyclase domain-containing protein [Actimicrobium sp. CCI2.3]|uniref:CHASE2 domain-containing protein n=1 Tax=Actimicrobium sp. CCI2.3 TaxID=3048616 RepID=UPI002AB49A8B|nr:adenylate/guanylate cyclase domain-containing protein [Actimicrobium sp. CCI2.3]MDY7573526.1 adenylate/guanylate cyclase domain-containing protein [Actimicrobium sp. CCI2.3]MEB0022039.1 adenylate/guanylate cyclase domain-containing protein [Actimicrobium sp. CCI2.3]